MKYHHIFVSGYHDIYKYRNIIFMIQIENLTKNNSNKFLMLLWVHYLATGECILIYLRCFKPNNLYICISSINIYIGINVLIQKHCNGNFSGPQEYNVSKDWMIISHNKYSSFIIYFLAIINITAMYTLSLNQSYLNLFLIWNFHLREIEII